MIDPARPDDAIDAAVAARMRQTRVGSGLVPYLFAVFRTLATFTAVQGRISAGGRTEETSIFLAAVGNGTSSGAIDIRLLNPLIFTPDTQDYYGIGAFVAKVFSAGKDI